MRDKENNNDEKCPLKCRLQDHQRTVRGDSIVECQSSASVKKPNVPPFGIGVRPGPRHAAAQEGWL
jgi:hypothetical protein